jgi:hypothetical protein
MRPTKGTAPMMWTEPKIRKLIEMWNLNIETRAIAGYFGDDTTRNAILGKIRRLRRSKEWGPLVTRKMDDRLSHNVARQRKPKGAHDEKTSQ